MNAIDLFAGLGGFSEGAEQAGCTVVWAANHWQAAVDMHKLNHPDTDTRCQDLQQANFALVPAHDLLLASPACQGHSIAKGKERPHHDALRSTAWAVVTAMEVHKPMAAIVENVPEFTKWNLYPVWLEAMKKLGYTWALYLIDAADHGVPQNRERIFIVLTRSASPIILDLPKRARMAARDIVRFDEAHKWSPIHKPGRSLATLQRIQAGRKAFGDRFVMPYYGNGSGLTGRSLDRPLGTITTKNRWGVVDGDRMRMLAKEETRDFMGFRNTYQLPKSMTEATFMLGNAVCPVVARDLITSLKQRI